VEQALCEQDSSRRHGLPVAKAGSERLEEMLGAARSRALER